MPLAWNNLERDVTSAQSELPDLSNVCQLRCSPL